MTIEAYSPSRKRLLDGVCSHGHPGYVKLSVSIVDGQRVWVKDFGGPNVYCHSKSNDVRCRECMRIQGRRRRKAIREAVSGG